MGRGASTKGRAFPRGDDMQNETLRSEATEKRRLAEKSRRLAGLMHQPDVKRDLMREANVLEQLAHELEEILRASDESLALELFSGARVANEGFDSRECKQPGRLLSKQLRH
jgi:hypothetical protein